MLNRLMTDVATVIRLGTPVRDRLGRIIKTEASRMDYQAHLEQRRTSEEEAFTVNSWIGWFPPGADIRAGDRVIANGKRYEIEGEPYFRSLPGFPGADHVEVPLKYVGSV